MVLFIFLISRGISPQAGHRDAGALAIIPAFSLSGIFTIWWSIARWTPATVALWDGGDPAGAALGYFLIKQAAITRAEAPRSLHRQVDYTALPFMMLAFAVKYVLGDERHLSPYNAATRHECSGDYLRRVFAGVFIGKFARYVEVYNRSVPQPAE